MRTVVKGIIKQPFPFQVFIRHWKYCDKSYRYASSLQELTVSPGERSRNKFKRELQVPIQRGENGVAHGIQAQFCFSFWPCPSLQVSRGTLVLLNFLLGSYQGLLRKMDWCLSFGFQGERQERDEHNIPFLPSPFFSVLVNPY